VRIALASIFPEMFHTFLQTGVVGRAVSSGLLEVTLHDIREHAVDARGSVDDYQFGGGAGMVMRPEPLFETLESIEWHSGSRVILMTPQGRELDHDLAVELAGEERLVVFSGRYGGVDERFRTNAVTDEISVGEAVSSGGEIPAMFLLEAVARWVPGVLGRMESAETDSFATGLLDYPRYTRPAEYRGMEVPEVLLSGNHAAVEEWRFQRALDRTRRRRPDLPSLERYTVDQLREKFVQALRKAGRDKEPDNG
jgi:tRNA (guanine37-N1)-methyltransferase